MDVRNWEPQPNMGARLAASDLLLDVPVTPEQAKDAAEWAHRAADALVGIADELADRALRYADLSQVSPTLAARMVSWAIADAMLTVEVALWDVLPCEGCGMTAQMCICKQVQA